MDDASVRHYLTTLVEESLKAAGVCSKLLDIFEETPLSSLGMTSRVEELERRLLMYQEQERELKEEVAKLKEGRDSLREKERKLQAQCNMEVGLRKTAQDSYQNPDKVVIDGVIVDPPVPVIISESELKTRRQRIIESPPRPKDAPSSSTVPPTSSSSPMDASLPGPGGVLPDSGGGDPSILLPKK
ncbi:uncharacterized protein LOC107607518 [Arachis ipaensis]|uniref:uncharacterized protein LOC107607518 n=1 Tax=Arachis ipaensis TaxID=130454 RepID=UPI0007AF029B|nr:uncharacterized protein LOC107607518 [Arachis ipaensis]